MNKVDRFRGCLLGLACGDAVGTTVEFRPRGTFKPVVGMTGGGPFSLTPGEWTDDTSMALCMASSLVELDRFDARDMMERFCLWMDEGYLSSNGSCFDIGGTVHDALWQFKETGEPFSGSTDRFSAGNGCLMRLAPVPMFFYPDLEQVIDKSGRSSRLTHGAQECVEATRLFGAMLFRALSGETKEAILGESGLPVGECESVTTIAAGSYRRKTKDEIRGSGYVIDSLEAALWCFANAATFEEAILRAANLGDDADTTAAICGQLAGAHYGMAGIPLRWLDTLVMRDEIRELADKLNSRSDVRTCGESPGKV